MLLEPTTIVAKAWEQVQRIGARAFYDPHVAVVTGAGPVGMLAALLGVQLGLEVRVFDRVTDGPKPDLVRSLGATYHHDAVPDSGVTPDTTIECTGVAEVIADVIANSAPDAITCLTGVSTPGSPLPFDLGGWNRGAVLGNDVVFGTVNAKRRHYEAAAVALKAADRDWLNRLITRRVPLASFRDAFAGRPDDVKVVLDLQVR